VAIWIVGLLSLLIGSFAFDMHLEARVTSYCRKRLRAEYLSRSGIEVAHMLLAKSGEIKKNALGEEEGEEVPWYSTAKRLSQGLGVTDIEVRLGEGVIRLAIVPEPSRRNVNRLAMDDWERILEVGDVPEEKWPQLIDCFFDWTDADNDPRADGAETEEWYQILDPPRRAKNASLDTVEELLDIKGFTPEILSGGLPPDAAEGDEPMSGIADLLTVFGDGKVNVNAASERVLMTLPDVDQTVALEIIDEREGSGAPDAEDASYRSVDDFCGRFPDLATVLRNRIVTESGIYRIVSVGNVHGVERTVRCIVSFGGAAMNVLRWWEDEP
jgi:type II secretory pathway component PulK